MSECAAFKLQNRRGHILGFAILVGIDIKVCADDTLDRPHEPEHQIDVMHALVHNGAAAVQFPCAVPADVVAVGPSPFHAEFAQQRSAEGTLLQCGVDASVVASIAFPEVHEQFDFVVLASLDERVAVFDADIHRFGSDDVLAAPRCFLSEFAVEPAWCHYHRNVNVTPVEHFECVAVAFAAEAFFGGFAAFLNQICDGDELGTVSLVNYARPVHTHAESDNAKT